MGTEANKSLSQIKGYANSLMTLINVVLAAQYPQQYVSAVSTRVSESMSNAAPMMGGL